MADILTYVFLFALMALAVVAGLWVFKSYINGQSPTSALFGPQAREAAGGGRACQRRWPPRLMLVRRDGVEHLIMTGGPVDVVIETGNRRAEGPARSGRSPPRLRRCSAGSPASSASSAAERLVSARRSAQPNRRHPR